MKGYSEMSFYYEKIYKDGNMIFVSQKHRLFLPRESVKCTIGKLMNKSHSAWRKLALEHPRCCLYIIRDSDQRVLYVGITRAYPRNRMQWHIYGKSEIGRIIREAFPESDSWEVEIINMTDMEMARKEERRYIDALQPIFNKSRKAT